MKFIRTILSLLLTLIIAVGAPVQSIAASQPVYISDVMVGMGETADEAKSALTSAGYTVLDRNLNEGAGSKMKTEKFVYIGYKTTTVPEEAITDLAVMNMNGGYSFSDYRVLMDKYRDSQIKPFIDNFIATIEEYRANYNSDNEANRAKAEYAYTILSAIIEDDTGGNMGDLLLNPTKEELGLSDDEYKALPDEERKNTVDLTTALMQGNAQVIFLMEQTLAIAADANDTTWLERLSELGPDGLDMKYAEAGVRPADASREMASLYNDTAKALLYGWETTRSELLACESSLADEQAEAGSEAEEPDVSALINIGVEDAEAEEDDDALEPTGMMNKINGSLEASVEVAETVEDSRVAAVYALLKEIPYGDGTMYDFFTLPYAEVSGENISALYPMVSTLTEGQIAAIEFLPLELILQIGATDGESYIDCGTENSDLLEVIKTAGLVSLYLNVNREIFGKTTALTSKALREQALSGKGWTSPDSDLFGLSRLTALTWAATGVSLAVTLIATYKVSSIVSHAESLVQSYNKLGNSLKYFTNAHTNLTSKFSLSFIDKSGNTLDLTRQVAESTKFTVSKTSSGFSFNYVCDTDKIWKANSEVLNNDAMLTLSDYGDAANHSMVVKTGSEVAEQIDTQITSTQELATQIENKTASVNSTAKSLVTWRNVGTAITAILTVVSIVMTVYDLYRYYNITYTPIPKYIVDEADITTLDADGNQLVVRNDTAYYSVVPTNRPETHEQYEALQDYADLNGDVGQEWLALYSVKMSGGDPILADSFKIVTGTTSMPEDYTKGIHMFGSTAVANLTDSRYTYNDNLNGIYVYFKTESSPSADTASAFSGGALALVGVGGALVGSALGSIAANLVKRRKKPLAA